MLGAILGDMIGSYYEAHPNEEILASQSLNWGNYSDDTVLTVATMDKLLQGGSYTQIYRSYYLNDSDRDYGARFANWAISDRLEAYGSYGNGAAMRVSPIGFIAEDESWLEQEVRSSAEVSHNHPEGVKGAQAIAFCIYWLRKGKDKNWIRQEVEERFDYDLNCSIEELGCRYALDASAMGSVPPAICCFLSSSNLMQAIGNAVGLGGDMDTMADMAGALGEAAYGIGRELSNEILLQLPRNYQMTIKEFYRRYMERNL